MGVGVLLFGVGDFFGLGGHWGVLGFQFLADFGRNLQPGGFGCRGAWGGV